MQRGSFIQEFSPTAIEYSKLTGIPPEVFMAIIASESNWGEAGSLFGIKGSSPSGKSNSYATVEGANLVPTSDTFATYDNQAEAYNHFLSLISQGRYKPAWDNYVQTGNWQQLLQDINKAGYATDPLWASKITALSQNISGGQGSNPNSPGGLEDYAQSLTDAKNARDAAYQKWLDWRNKTLNSKYDLLDVEKQGGLVFVVPTPDSPDFQNWLKDQQKKGIDVSKNGLQPFNDQEGQAIYDAYVKAEQDYKDLDTTRQQTLANRLASSTNNLAAAKSYVDSEAGKSKQTLDAYNDYVSRVKALLDLADVEKTQAEEPAKLDEAYAQSLTSDKKLQESGAQLGSSIPGLAPIQRTNLPQPIDVSQYRSAIARTIPSSAPTFSPVPNSVFDVLSNEARSQLEKNANLNSSPLSASIPVGNAPSNNILSAPEAPPEVLRAAIEQTQSSNPQDMRRLPNELFRGDISGVTVAPQGNQSMQFPLIPGSLSKYAYGTSDTPMTSQTPQPGYVPATTVGGQRSNITWQSDIVNYLLRLWAQTGQFPAGWNWQVMGAPNETDRALILQGYKPSQQTANAFLNYAQQYKPGMDTNLEAQFPYVPPSPTDYIEGPDALKNRVASTQQQFNNQQIQAQQDYNNRALAQQLGISQETLANSRLATAGNLAQALAQIQSQERDRVAQLQANPGDFIQAESVRRNLIPPTATPLSVVGQSGSLQDIINRLLAQQNQTINSSATPPSASLSTSTSYKPGAVFDTQGGQVTIAPPIGTPMLNGRPAPVTLSDYALGNIAPGAGGFSFGVGAGDPDKALADRLVQEGKLQPVGTAGDQSSVYQTPGQNLTIPTAPSVAPSLSGVVNYDPTKGDTPFGSKISGYAQGTPGTPEKAFITGDPQADGMPNPELNIVHDPEGNATTEVLPLKDMHQMPDGSMMKNDMMGKGMMQDKTMGQSSGIVKLLSQVMQDIASNWGATGGTAQYAYGTDKLSHYAYGTNPYSADEWRVLSQEERNAQADRSPWINASSSTAMRPPATGTVNTYSNEAYQNLPSLAFLQGRLGSSAYNTLGTGKVEGAFGTALPLSGNLNYRKLSDILNDPMATQLLSSLYRSGSLDFGSEVARARARAPLGSALSSSLIRT